MDKITEKDKFLEILSNIRHYSTLRFAMLTVFVAINGGMLTQFFDCDFALKNPDAIKLFQFGGGILSLIFFIFERALDHNLSNYWDTIKAYVGEYDALVSNRSWVYTFSVPLATHGIFVIAFLFWVFFSQDYFPCIK